MNIAPTNFSQHAKKETVANGAEEGRREKRERERGRRNRRREKKEKERKFYMVRYVLLTAEFWTIVLCT